jgi:hypothetical protein
MTKITATIFEDAEAWLCENVAYMSVDNVSSVYPTTNFNPTGLTKFIDDYENDIPVVKEFTIVGYVEALKKLCKLIDDKKLFVGGVKSAQDLTDAGNWDVEVVDAFYQLIYHGEVIYG